MNPAVKVGLFAVAIIVVCCAISLTVVRLLYQPRVSEEEFGHEWLHDRLHLSEAEETALISIEKDYDLQKRELEEQFDERKTRLAKLLIDQSEYTDETTKAVLEIHMTHGELQKLSIEHYFDMMGVLSTANQAKLKRLAAEALSHPE